MTVKEAIENITEIKKCEAGVYAEALEIAIQALEQEPCDAAISRQIISDYVGSHIQEINTGYGDLNKHTNEILRMIVDYIESMPPATPKPKMGRWITNYHGFPPEPTTVCSECGFDRDFYIHPRVFNKLKFCPNCGAKTEAEE